MFNTQRTTHNAQRKGQHLSECALILSLVLAALIAMQTYVKRGLQGRYRDATDRVVSALQEATGDSSFPLQYEPYYTHKSGETTSDITTTISQNKTEEVFLGGSKEITILEDDPNTTTIKAGSYRKILSAQEADE